MSKMGQELEKRLDEAKYDLYKALVLCKQWVDDPDMRLDEVIPVIKEALAKVEGK